MTETEMPPINISFTQKVSGNEAVMTCSKSVICQDCTAAQICTDTV